ncbi:T9SS type A sorting domain-containing protein [Aequorivita todarodis]|uniref:T9SS type A sorting domain-containing protein n=1 Tax=Aequorivita todarodis TaxID=2036821 RepID=UPI002350F8D0|nr:T9SS type A sorting domain-containing protein [Aequorivita todarodis]MDC8000903.1 T9SS type A sorting domain-containing protein [Aequorivita todarodis]
MKTLLLFLVGVLSFVAFGQDGSPDLSFGDYGFVLTEIGPGDNFVNGYDQSLNDRVIVIGKNYNFALGEETNFILAYFEDGSIDTSFGNNGILWTDGTDEDYRGIRILPNENMLLKSYIGDHYTIKRLLPNGLIDTAFGNNGQIQPLFSYGYGNSMILDSANNMLVLGVDPSYSSIIIRKFDINGMLDTDFGIDGTVSHSLGNIVELRTNAFVLKENTIFIGVRYKVNNIYSSHILKFLENGELDTAFGDNGMATIPVEPEYNTSFSLLQDGSFLVGCYYYDFLNDVFVRKTIKLFPNAMLDQNFGNAGAIEGYAGSYVQENGRILLNRDYYDFEGGITPYYSRFFPGGIPDNSFQFNSNYAELGSAGFLALNSGKFLIIGTDIWYNGPPINIVLQRFNNTPLSIADFNIQKTTIYPNPSTGIFTIERELFSERTPFTITDITGKTIASGELTEKQSQIDLASAQSGIYFLKTQNGIFRLLKN